LKGAIETQKRAFAKCGVPFRRHQRDMNVGLRRCFYIITLTVLKSVIMDAKRLYIFLLCGRDPRSSIFSGINFVRRFTITVHKKHPSETRKFRAVKELGARYVFCLSSFCSRLQVKWFDHQQFRQRGDLKVAGSGKQCTRHDIFSRG